MSFAPASEQDVNEDEYSADGDGGIRDVEGGPGIESLPSQKRKIDLQKIGDGAVKDAIRDVACGSAEEKSEASGICAADAAAGDEQPGNKSNDDEGTGDKDNTENGRRKRGEKTERDARVAGVNQVEKILDHRMRKLGRGAGFDPGLCKAVEEHHCQGKPEKTEAGGKSHEVWEVQERKDTKKSELRAP